MRRFLQLPLCLSLTAWTHGGTIGAGTTLTADFASHTGNIYTASLSAAGKGSYVNGVDYTQSITYYSTLPGRTATAWSWPNTPSTGVYAFNSLWFGNYFYGTTSPSVVFEKVNAISALVETHNLTLTGTASNYNVIIDLFLNAQPAGVGDSGTTKVDEIEVFLNPSTSGINYINSVTQLGTYTDAQSRSWQVGVDTSGKDILFMPTSRAQVLSASIDLKAMFSWLVTQGSTLTGNEYFGGLATGAEPIQGNGSVAWNSYSVSYQ